MPADTERRIATCSCGQVRVRVPCGPARATVCHCLACQKRTGSVFGVQAAWPKDQVITEGETRIWRRIGDEGTAMDFHFCPICGNTVWFSGDHRPELIAVAVGAFADPQFPAPVTSIYDDRQHAWVSLPEEIREVM